MDTDMKCGPDNCPIVAFSDLTPAEQRVERQRTAKKMTDQGFTEKQIAKQLGVSQQTISLDLAGLPIVGKPPRPKGGRPKGTGKPKQQRGVAEKFTKARAVVRPLVEADDNLETAELEKAHGISKDTFERAALAEQARKEALVELEVDPKTLAMTAQQKLDIAIRQEKKKLEANFYAAVNDRVKERIDEIMLPKWKQQIEEANKIYLKRRGMMTKDTFNTIRRALHPDSRHSISDKKLGEAFDAFMGLEKYLLDEKDSPTTWPTLPQNMAEWDRMKAAATAARRAKRAGASSLRPR